MLAAYDGDHSDWCEKCDEGGNLLCCDFCHAVYHPECLDPPMKGASTAKYWACDECAEDMWCAYSGQPRATRPTLSLRVQGDSSSAASMLSNLAQFGDNPAATLAALAAGGSGEGGPALMPSVKRPRSAYFNQPKPLPKSGATGGSSGSNGRLRDAKQYIGVAFDASTGLWHANGTGSSTSGGAIQRSGSASKRRESVQRLGPFRDAESAARAHDVAVRKVKIHSNISLKIRHIGFRILSSFMHVRGLRCYL